MVRPPFTDSQLQVLEALLEGKLKAFLDNQPATQVEPASQEKPSWFKEVWVTICTVFGFMFQLCRDNLPSFHSVKCWLNEQKVHLGEEGELDPDNYAGGIVCFGMAMGFVILVIASVQITLWFLLLTPVWVLVSACITYATMVWLVKMYGVGNGK